MSLSGAASKITAKDKQIAECIVPLQALAKRHEASRSIPAAMKINKLILGMLKEVSEAAKQENPSYYLAQVSCERALGDVLFKLERYSTSLKDHFAKAKNLLDAIERARPLNDKEKFEQVLTNLCICKSYLAMEDYEKAGDANCLASQYLENIQNKQEFNDKQVRNHIKINGLALKAALTKVPKAIAVQTDPKTARRQLIYLEVSTCVPEVFYFAEAEFIAGRFSEAAIFYKILLDLILRTDLKNSSEESIKVLYHCELKLAHICAQQNKNTQAIEYLKTSIQHQEAVQDIDAELKNFGLAETYKMLCSMYCRQNKYLEAQNAINKGRFYLDAIKEKSHESSKLSVAFELVSKQVQEALANKTTAEAKVSVSLQPASTAASAPTKSSVSVPPVAASTGVSPDPLSPVKEKKDVSVEGKESEGKKETTANDVLKETVKFLLEDAEKEYEKVAMLFKTNIHLIATTEVLNTKPAEECFQGILDLLTKSAKDNPEININFALAFSQCERYLASIYTLQNKYDKATQHTNLAIKYLATTEVSKLGDDENLELAQSYMALATAHHVGHKDELAGEALSTAFAYLEKVNDKKTKLYGQIISSLEKIQIILKQLQPTSVHSHIAPQSRVSPAKPAKPKDASGVSPAQSSVSRAPAKATHETNTAPKATPAPLLSPKTSTQVLECPASDFEKVFQLLDPKSNDAKETKSNADAFFNVLTDPVKSKNPEKAASAFKALVCLYSPRNSAERNLDNIKLLVECVHELKPQYQKKKFSIQIYDSQKAQIVGKSLNQSELEKHIRATAKGITGKNLTKGEVHKILCNAILPETIAALVPSPKQEHESKAVISQLSSQAEHNPKVDDAPIVKRKPDASRSREAPKVEQANAEIKKCKELREEIDKFKFEISYQIQDHMKKINAKVNELKTKAARDSQIRAQAEYDKLKTQLNQLNTGKKELTKSSSLADLERFWTQCQAFKTADDASFNVILAEWGALRLSKQAPKKVKPADKAHRNPKPGKGQKRAVVAATSAPLPAVPIPATAVINEKSLEEQHKQKSDASVPSATSAPAGPVLPQKDKDKDLAPLHRQKPEEPQPTPASSVAATPPAETAPTKRDTYVPEAVSESKQGFSHYVAMGRMMMSPANLPSAEVPLLTPPSFTGPVTAALPPVPYYYVNFKPTYAGSFAQPQKEDPQTQIPREDPDDFCRIVDALRLEDDGDPLATVTHPVLQNG